MTGRSRSLKRFRLVPLAGLVAICVETASLAQGSNVTKPPPILKSAGQFRAALLSRPPLIDGREWIVPTSKRLRPLVQSRCQPERFPSR